MKLKAVKSFTAYDGDAKLRFSAGREFEATTQWTKESRVVEKGLAVLVEEPKPKTRRRKSPTKD